jgi:hypothetical protein
VSLRGSGPKPLQGNHRASSETAAGLRCINCGHEPVEKYCGRCGQRQRRSRFSLRPLLRQAADDAFNLDQGLLHTVIALTRRPGPMVREYLSGRTRPYTNPVKYLIICAALATFVSLSLGYVEAQFEATIVAPAETDEITDQLIDWSRRYFNLLVILGVPLLAVFSRLVFRGAPYNFTEHLIFNVYVYAHLNLAFVISLPIWSLLSGNLWLYAQLYLLLIVVYYVWVCRQFFEVGLASSAWRGTLVMALGYAVFILIVGGAVGVWLLVRGG